MKKHSYFNKTGRISFGIAAAALTLSGNVLSDQVILDDLIVDGSICAGEDCVNGESFGFDTIRLKENNLRIRAVDTSTTSSFPSRDWQITFNDSANGGVNKFSIDDIDGGRTPFTIEAAAPSHSLYVDDGGRVGFGTSAPVVDLHVKSGNTPTLRLEQDGTSGFTPQAWDVAGNEANFFIRDATNGSTLPFRIQPGAPSSSLSIMSDGKVGMGTWSPSYPVHLLTDSITEAVIVAETSGGASAQVTGTPTTVEIGAYTNHQLEFTIDDTSKMVIDTNGNVGMGTTVPSAALHILTSGALPRIMLDNGDYSNSASDVGDWYIDVSDNGDFRISVDGNGQQEFLLDVGTGDLEIQGSYKSAGVTLTVPDYVFANDYKLRSIDDLKQFIDDKSHLPNVPSATDIKADGLNMTTFQMVLLEKIEESTLYTISQQDLITELQARLDSIDHKHQP